MDAAEQLSIPVKSDVIGLLECGNEESDVALACVFDAEVIYNKAESEGSSFVSEKAGREGCRGEVCFFEMTGQFLVREYAGLWQTVHPGDDFG